MSYNEIDATAYQDQFVDNDEVDYVLVDVREVDEFVGGRLPGAVNIPLSEFRERFTEVPKDKDVVLVCGHGMRSAQAAEFLTFQNYDASKLHNLLGGTVGWIMQGRTIEN